MRIVLLGPPGSGKGTQARHISSVLRVPSISTGDLLRAAVAEQTPLGRRVTRYMREGSLVPDDLVFEILSERLSGDDCRQGFLLDGYPRTVSQAETLDAYLRERSLTLNAVIDLVVADAVILERMSGRRVCPSCGRVYHVIAQPPRREGVCDDCGTVLVRREDDEPDTVRHRLNVYHAQTEPLIEYYRDSGLLLEVDGEGSPESVQASIDRVLEDLTSR